MIFHKTFSVPLNNIVPCHSLFMYSKYFKIIEPNFLCFQNKVNIFNILHIHYFQNYTYSMNIFNDNVLQSKKYDDEESK